VCVCAFATTSMLIRWHAAVLPEASHFDAWTHVCVALLLHTAQRHNVCELLLKGRRKVFCTMAGKEARFARCMVSSVKAGMHLLLLLCMIYYMQQACMVGVLQPVCAPGHPHTP
jgi:hypothetical protein